MLSLEEVLAIIKDDQNGDHSPTGADPNSMVIKQMNKCLYLLLAILFLNDPLDNLNCQVFFWCYLMQTALKYV